MAEWKAGDRCRVVEHDDDTRQPKPGGRVYPAVVTHAAGIYIRAEFSVADWDRDAKTAMSFFAESGWAAWDGMFRWRLLPGAAEPTKSVRCAWCEVELAAIDAAPIKYARNPSAPDEENMQCADAAACRDRQDVLDEGQRRELTARGLGWLVGLTPAEADEAAAAAGEQEQ